jgi:hypothetical protein
VASIRMRCTHDRAPPVRLGRCAWLRFGGSLSDNAKAPALGALWLVLTNISSERVSSMSNKLLARALPAADFAIPADSAVIEVRQLRGAIGKYVVVVCNADGTVNRVDSVRGMGFERAKARAAWLAGCPA